MTNGMKKYAMPVKNS